MANQKKEDVFIFVGSFLLYYLFSIQQCVVVKEQEKYKSESEVRKMTMEEVKTKLLEKIDFLLENADAEDVRRLADAYGSLHRETIMEIMAKNNNSMFGGVAGLAPGTEEKE